MRKSFWKYYWDSLHNYGEAVINIFIFLPYFFSVAALLKTLLRPWRNLVVKKTFVGFSFSDWANRFAFNLISRIMGFVMRISIVCFYFLMQTLLMVSLPFISLIFFIMLPFFYFFSSFKKTSVEEKEIFKEKFLKTHMLNNENKSDVVEWFERYYRLHLEKTTWWKLGNLFAYPPLGRDWAFGYSPALDRYATDLATPEYLHHIKNMVDRDREIVMIEKILMKSVENSVVIVGDEGVGKHTIVDAFAKKIYLGNASSYLIYHRILKLNLEKILNEFTDQKQRENFFNDLLKEASQAKNIILFIENLDKYISSVADRVDLTRSFEKYTQNGQVQIIGITTPYAYEQYFFPNEKINRIFSKIEVHEVTKDEAKAILLDTVYDFENHYKVFIPYETIEEVIEKSEFYLTYIPFPEKAVDLLDTACAYIEQKHAKIVLPAIIDTVLTEKTHVPITINKQMKEKLLNMEDLLASNIVQQEEAIKELSASLRRSFLLIGKRKKPLATFLFVGPTGVGKTETAKAIANVFFTDIGNSANSDDNYLIRFDMSEFQSKYDIPKLIGDANNPGLLTKAIREQSFGVLLLDEIEKADKNLINIFLTIIDEGYFTDGQGKRVDCKNLIIIATSNAGSDFLYSQADPTSQGLISHLIKQGLFSPEFINRFDGVITYKSLTPESLRILAKKIIERICIDILQLYKVKVTVSEKTIDSVVAKGYNPAFGARNLERTIRDDVEDKVAKIILEDKAKDGQTIIV